VLGSLGAMLGPFWAYVRPYVMASFIKNAYVYIYIIIYIYVFKGRDGSM
jgi:hypothetical protein